MLLGVLWLGGLTSVVSYPGLPSPPDITAWLLPATRYARDIMAALTVGAVVVGGVLVPGGSPRVLRWARRWGAGWLALVVLGLVLTRSEVEALPPIDALAPESLMPLLVGETVGRVFLFQFVAVIAVIGLTWAIDGRQAPQDARSDARDTQGAHESRARRGAPEGAVALAWLCALLAISAAAAPAFVGHGGLHDSHVAATVSLLLHIAAVSIWVGGLAVVVALGRLEPNETMAVLPRFSVVALWCVIIIAETGLLNASLRLGLPSEFVGTLYGSLIIAKAALLGWLVVFGQRQRRSLFSRPADGGSTLRGRRSAVAGATRLPLATANTLSPQGDETPGTAVDGRIAADGRVGASGILARYAAWEFLIMGTAIALSITLARLGPAPAEVATGNYSPVSLAVLGIGVPLLFTWIGRARAGAVSTSERRGVSRGQGRRSTKSQGKLLRWLKSHPEVPAVVFLVVVAEVAGLQALNDILGVQLGTIIGVLAIVSVGWLWASCAQRKDGWSGTLIVMIGWPLVIWFNGLMQGTSADPGAKITVATVLIVEAALGARLVRALLDRSNSAGGIADPEERLLPDDQGATLVVEAERASHTVPG